MELSIRELVFLQLAMQDTIKKHRVSLENIETYDRDFSIGLGIHEMGTARMGATPEDSVLNKWNQVWGAPNVFCTDGAAMVSAGCQNPSLTYMALTARAVDHALEEMKKGNL
jgi:choline dehydrogenase-like flavoprotein